MSAGGSTAMTALELLKAKQQEAYDLALEKHIAAGGDESNFDKDNRTAATDLYNLADPKTSSSASATLQSSSASAMWSV